MKYLDANVFIYAALAQESESKAVAAKKILEGVIGGSIPGATSALSWDELVWAVKKFEGTDIAKEAGKKFLTLPRLKLLQIGEATAHSAQDLITKYKLAPRDAIHAACCIENGIEEIISDDTDFDGIVGLKRMKLEEVV